VHRRFGDALNELRSGKGKFDLILLDLGLPDNKGLEALHHVRAAAPRIPTIVLTGRADEQLATEALHYGAQDYLVKGQHDPLCCFATTAVREPWLCCVSVRA